MAAVPVRLNLPCQKVPWIKCIGKEISRECHHPKHPSRRKRMTRAKTMTVDVESSLLSFFVAAS
jgi:hypothetical protein